MPETLSSCAGSPRWLWHSVMKDLEEQGGLPGVVIDPLTLTPSGCSGQTEKGQAFVVTWCHEEFLMVTTLVEVPELIEAFAKVVGYRPLCKYTKNRMVTFEWDKVHPTDRFLALSFDQEITSLTRIDQ